MDSPKVSVIVNNYNYGRFLRVCLDSVLSQTYRNIELIVVDDGSTDHSREVLEHYKDFAKIIFKENGGESSGRNEGFRHASGDIVAFLDADDYWKPQAVAKAVENWRPGLSKLQFPLEVIDSVGQMSGTLMPRCRLDSGFVAARIVRAGKYSTCPTSGNFYARWLLEKIIPVPVQEWPQSADSYFATYAGFYGEIGVISKPLGFYRVHDDNATRIAADGSAIGVNVTQLRRLMDRGLRLRRLVQKVSEEFDFKASPDVVTSHWTYLKLELAYAKLLPNSRPREVSSSAFRLMLSALTSPELDFVKRIQLMLWTAGTALLPRTAVQPLLKSGFDLAPAGWLVRSLRRL